MSKIERFFEDLKTKKVAVVGAGVSHFDLIKLFLSKNIDVTVLDRAEKLSKDELYNLGAKFILGDKYLDNLSQFDVIFRTPGLNYFNEKLVEARAYGCIVTSELECFLPLCPCKVYGISGSDGKTTTSTLISEMLKASGKRVHLGGNIGRALLPIIEDIKEDDRCVVELSSFQLISMRYSPNVAVLTNITPNHLDVHKNMDEYIGAKCNLIAHQDGFSKTVLNLDNQMTARLASMVRGRLSYFSCKSLPQNGAYFAADGCVYIVKNGSKVEVMKASDIRIPGMHNVQNYLAAISACCDEVDVLSIVKVAKEFKGVEHRIELVRELNGVKYYNDSIGTSPTRTIAGLNCFTQKVIMIAGGYDKKIPYEPLAPAILQKVKSLILMGDTACKIKKAVCEAEGYNEGEIEIYNVDSMEEAVAFGHRLGKDKDIVVLSPASASFDKYANFEERGLHFKRLVCEL